MVTPSNLRHSEDSMVFPWKCKGMLLSALLCFKVIVWYLLRFPFIRLLAYHSEALLAFLKILVLAIFGSPVVSDVWWSSAYMERCEVIYVCSITMGLFCSYHILTSSVIYYWTDARQPRIYLFFLIKNLKKFWWWRHLYVCLPIDHKWEPIRMRA